MFDRTWFLNNVFRALREFFPGTTVRWPDSPGFSRATAANYIVNNMCWSRSNRSLSVDLVVNASFVHNSTPPGGVKAYQVAVAEPGNVKKGLGGLFAAGNTVVGPQRPPGLVTKP